MICHQCDPSDAGTWFLSYLAELGYIDNVDDVYGGTATGDTKQGFLGLPDGISIYVRIDLRDKALFHVYYGDAKKEDEDEDEDNDEPWWEKPGVKKLDFRFSLTDGVQVVK